MKNDSISASLKIKELFDLHRSGIITVEEYRSQLKSWIIIQLQINPSKGSETGNESAKVSKKNFRVSSGKLMDDDFDLTGSVKTVTDDDQPIKARVEKILWTHLN